jgi:hypothetical protein
MNKTIQWVEDRIYDWLGPDNIRVSRTSPPGAWYAMRDDRILADYTRFPTAEAAKEWFVKNFEIIAAGKDEGTRILKNANAKSFWVAPKIRRSARPAAHVVTSYEQSPSKHRVAEYHITRATSRDQF